MQNPQIIVNMLFTGQAAVVSGIRQTQAAMHAFGASANEALNNTIKLTRKLSSELGGMEGLSKLASSLDVMSHVRTAMNTNLDFERGVLEMKQQAGMTVQQANEIRSLAIDKSAAALQTPQEMLEGAQTMARSGAKYGEIKAQLLEAGQAATVLRDSVKNVAEMDVDLGEKMRIDPANMRNAHNLLNYHGNAGGFGATELTRGAPGMLSAAADIGLQGVQGLNLTGALAPLLMKANNIKDAGKAGELMEQGMKGLADADTLKKLGKITGIDTARLAPDGKLGVEGMFRVSDALASKGLTSTEALGKAGIKDASTAKLLSAMAGSQGALRQEMGNAAAAAGSDKIGADLAEIREANFGKIKASEIELAKMSLSDGAGKATNVAANVAQWAGENPVAAAMAALTGKLALDKGLPILGNKVAANVAAREAARRTPPAPSPLQDARGKPLNQPDIDAWHAKQAADAARKKETFALGKRMGRFGGGVLTGAIAAGEAIDIARSDNLSSSQKKVAWSGVAGDVAGGLVGGWAGALAGAKLGAVVGSAFAPGVGTVVGGTVGLLGGLLGSYYGSMKGREAAKGLGQKAFEETPNKKMAVATDRLHPVAAALPPPPPVKVEVTLRMKNNELTASVNDANSRNARRQ